MGPSLADRDAHADIHEAARGEMEAGMALLNAAMAKGDAMTGQRLARQLADGWTQRVLAHADAEEQDMFPSILARLPALAPMISALIRDHELMRLLVAEIDGELDAHGEMTPALLGRFGALLHVQRLHSALEEREFLPRISGTVEEDPDLWPNA